MAIARALAGQPEVLLADEPTSNLDPEAAAGVLAILGELHAEGRAVVLATHEPQVVDVIANPRGAWYLTRDAENIGRWFAARGLSGVSPEPADLPGLLRREALL